MAAPLLSLHARFNDWLSSADRSCTDWLDRFLQEWEASMQTYLVAKQKEQASV